MTAWAKAMCVIDTICFIDFSFEKVLGQNTNGKNTNGIYENETFESNWVRN